MIKVSFFKKNNRKSTKVFHSVSMMNPSTTLKKGHILMSSLSSCPHLWSVPLSLSLRTPISFGPIKNARGSVISFFLPFLIYNI